MFRPFLLLQMANAGIIPRWKNAGLDAIFVGKIMRTRISTMRYARALCR